MNNNEQKFSIKIFLLLLIEVLILININYFQEVRSLREELSLQNNAVSMKLQKQESEISRLKSQLSAAATPSSEVESRLSSLTRTLVLKQQELEHLTTDRNALRLQLERLEVALLCFLIIIINKHCR